MQRGKTGKGYIYYRDRSNGHDATVYEHQLLALHEHDADEVFDDEHDVHHAVPTHDSNFPGLLHVKTRRENRSEGSNGDESWDGNFPAYIETHELKNDIVFDDPCSECGQTPVFDTSAGLICPFCGP